MSGKRRGKLAVFTPILGVPSESFITRHILGLCPGNTVVMALDRHPNGPPSLQAVPALVLGEVPELERRGWLRKPITRRDRIIRFLHEHGVETVLCEYLDFAVQFRRLVQNQGLRFVAYSHGYDLSRQECLEQWGARYPELGQADAVLAVSRFTRDKAIALGIDPHRLHVIPCGVEMPLSSKEPGKSVRTLISIGRLVPNKGPDLVVEAFARLAGTNPEIRLEIVGDGPLRESLEARTKDLGLAHRISFWGVQPHERCLDLLAGSDLFVQHNRVDPETQDMEGLPVAILEALAQGVPVVSTCHAGIPEVVIDGQTGWLVREGDVDGMAGAMQDAIRHPGETSRRGKEGRALVASSYTWEKSREKLLELLVPGGMS